MTMEHSGYDGHTFLRMANEIWPAAVNKTAQKDVKEFMTRVPPKVLQWKLPEVVVPLLVQAKENVAKLIASNEVTS